MTARTDKVKTGMDPHIHLFLALGLLLLTHIILMLIIQKVYDRGPTIGRTHRISIGMTSFPSPQEGTPHPRLEARLTSPGC